ncbi:MAG: thiamine diphosphokinase [bacterium]
MNEQSLSSRRTACICCNGHLRGFRRARKLAAGADMLIAADGGAEYVQALGLKPHAVIGDMDSLREYPWPGDEDLQRVRLPSKKDKCDGELAVEWAFEQGCDKALLLAAWGGRVDHALGNCALLMRYPVRSALWDDGILVMAMIEGQETTLPVPVGTAVSVISFQPGTIIRTQGFKYELRSQPLRWATHGMSNVAETASPVVSVAKGAIVVCMEGGETWLNE